MRGESRTDNNSKEDGKSLNTQETSVAHWYIYIFSSAISTSYQQNLSPWRTEGTPYNRANAPRKQKPVRTSYMDPFSQTVSCILRLAPSNTEARLVMTQRPSGTRQGSTWTSGWLLDYSIHCYRPLSQYVIYKRGSMYDANGASYWSTPNDIQSTCCTQQLLPLDVLVDGKKHFFPFSYINPTPPGPAEVMPEASTKRKRDQTRDVRNTVATARFEFEAFSCSRAT